ncbi:alpha/beta hydrolase [Fortiea contorta]|uniref:alpha/beta hydrolase n=1 Tax=Fortiea contorta TaxID=1892405 RepID=UPI0003664957|nr:alpha/beta hydrolase [Fortiea contorta]
MVGSRRSIKVIKGLFFALVLTQVFGKQTSVQAAETLVLRFGPLADSIPVSDLQTVAETGKFPKSLDLYTKNLSASQRDFVLGMLRARIPINVVTVSRLLNTQIGTTILNDLATAVVRKDNAGAKALRAGFVLSASKPEGLSVLNFIASYPSKRLEINVPQALKVARTLNTGFWVTQQFMLAIAPLFAPQKPQLAFSFDPSLPGSAAVKVLNLELNDQKRARNIPVDIYWSTAVNSEKPVIVYSHGFGSVRTDLRYLTEHLASHGYAVVTLEHPGSNSTSINSGFQNKTRLLKPQEVLDRPQDVSFVLDELEKIQKTPNHPLQGKLATNNVMVLGYSFGGGTALAIAGAEIQLERLKQRCKNQVTTLSFGETIQCGAQELPENNYQLRDARVKRAIALSPTTSLTFGETGLTKVQVPTLILASSADKTTPALSEQIIAFAKLPSPKWLVGILGSTHLSVKDPSTTMDQQGQANTPFFGGEIVGDKAVDVRKYVKAITLAFAAQMTPEADKYAPFLTPDYAQLASTEAFPIRSITEIPPQAQQLLKQYTQK